jgi:hypothetical protein
VSAITYDGSILVAGTPSTWKSSGGTYAITAGGLNSLNARQGVKSASLLVAPTGLQTASMPEVLRFIIQTQMASAPTAGHEISLWLGFSDSATAGTDNPGGLSGTDASVSNTDVIGQLVYAGSVILSNSLGTGVQLAYCSPVVPLDQYVCPVLFNQSSVSLSATSSQTFFTMIPYYRTRVN